MKISTLPLSLHLALGLAIAVAPAASANMLIDIQGNNASSVQWSPNKLGTPLPARVGTTLEIGDVVSVGQGVTATVLCADGTLWQLKSGQSAALEKGCATGASYSSRQVLVGGNDAVNLEGYPYTTSPRFTLVQPKNFTITWNSVPSASNYKVQIGELFGAVWETETSATSVKFDGSTPLETEVDYLVVVESDNGLSSVTASPPFGFRVATDEQIAEVTPKLEMIRESGLKGDALAIAEAGAYASGQFFADAIEVLNKSIASGSKEPAVYTSVGQLYRFVGLSRDAAESYEKAIALADPNKDVELLTSASANLAQLKTIISRHETQILQAKATMGYNAIGETESSGVLDESLAIAANTNSATAMRSGENSIFQSIMTPQPDWIPGGEATIADTSVNSNIRVRGGLGGENSAFGGERGAFGGEKGFGLDSTPENNQFGGENGAFGGERGAFGGENGWGGESGGKK